MESLITVINLIILQVLYTDLQKLFCLQGAILADSTEMSSVCVFKANQQTKWFLNTVVVFVLHLKGTFPSVPQLPLLWLLLSLKIRILYPWGCFWPLLFPTQAMFPTQVSRSQPVALLQTVEGATILAYIIRKH